MKIIIEKIIFNNLLWLWVITILFSFSKTLGQTLTPSPSPAPSVPGSQTQNQDKVFEEVFRKPRNQAQKVVVPFFIDEQQRGQVLLTLGAIPAVPIQAAPILAEIAKVIRPDIQKNLASAVDSEGNISLEVLQQNGLQVTFDRAKLELQIKVTPALRRTNIANLQNQNLPIGSENALRPSKFSGSMNFRLDQDYIWSGATQVQTGRQPLRFAIDGALNYKNWVLEGRSDFLEGRNPTFLNIVENEIDLAMIEAINRIGHVMGIKTIAEFVENEAILTKIQEVGVDYGQGYFLGAPRPLLINDVFANNSPILSC